MAVKTVANAEELLALGHGSIVVFSKDLMVPTSNGGALPSCLAVQVLGDDVNLPKAVYTIGFTDEFDPHLLAHWPGEVVFEL